MLAWMIYVVIVTTLLGVAALMAERSAQQRRRPGRWVWVAAIVASLMLPTIVASVSVQLPSLSRPTASSTPVVLRDVTSIPLPTAIIDLGAPDGAMTPYRLSRVLPLFWVASSMILLLALCLSATLLYWRKRRWMPGEVCGTQVLIAPDVGPAVVGLFRSRIVVPAWLLQAPERQQQLAMVHEQSHLDAHDPQVLTLALCLLLLMPWNLPLWWQLRRLRRAMEMDCDARVLSKERDVTEYCETLIEVGRNQTTYIGAVAAMSESTSFLEQRIRMMLRKPGKWAGASALTLISLSVAVAAFATQVTPPNATGADPVQAMSAVPQNLGDLAGYYKLSDLSVMTVSPSGKLLSIQLSGQSPVEFFPTGNDVFSAKVVKAELTFVRNAQGQVTATVLHQNGHETTAPRVSNVAADQINHALDARVSGQKPFPGSENALKLLLNETGDGDGMSPALVQARSNQKASRLKYLAKLGPVTGYEFAGVSAQGWDKYLVRREHGTEEMLFVLDSNGIIIGATRRP
jgi:beta-lactamase regulating signal transducer with metallopeptidase domain